MKDERTANLWPLGSLFDCPHCGYGATIDRLADFEVLECRGGKMHRISVTCPACREKTVKTAWASVIPPYVPMPAVTMAAAKPFEPETPVPVPGG